MAGMVWPYMIVDRASELNVVSFSLQSTCSLKSRPRYHARTEPYESSRAPGMWWFTLPVWRKLYLGWWPVDYFKRWLLNQDRLDWSLLEHCCNMDPDNSMMVSVSKLKDSLNGTHVACTTSGYGYSEFSMQLRIKSEQNLKKFMDCMYHGSWIFDIEHDSTKLPRILTSIHQMVSKISKYHDLVSFCPHDQKAAACFFGGGAMVTVVTLASATRVPPWQEALCLSQWAAGRWDLTRRSWHFVEQVTMCHRLSQVMQLNRFMICFYHC